MEVEAPSSVYRGEEVGLQISCFNWWNQYLEVESDTRTEKRKE